MFYSLIEVIQLLGSNVITEKEARQLLKIDELLEKGNK